MKITILADLYRDGTHDPTVDQVAGALSHGGHKVSKLLVPDDARAIVSGLARRKPDLVFHLIEDFGDVDDSHVATAGLLDALKLPYTGGGPGERRMNADFQTGVDGFGPSGPSSKVRMRW